MSAQELGDASLLFDSNEVARLSDADGLPVPAFIPATRPDPSELAAISRELQQWELQGIKLHTVLCSSYPANLRSVFDCPPLIFTKGSLAVIDAHGVAVVGTRKASREGLARATKLARELAESKITVYSGLAVGIDAAAQTSALRAGGRTVAVIGTGLLKAYPKENAALQYEIASRFAVVSQFWPDEKTERWHFPMRNKVMSGLARATVVVEDGDTSGAKLQAEAAIKHGKPVFLMASLVETYEWAKKFSQNSGVYTFSRTEELIEGLDMIFEEPLVACGF